MSTFTVKKLDNEPIVLFKVSDKLDMSRDVFAASDAVIKVVSSLDTPVFLVLDHMDNPPVDMDDLTIGASYVARGDNPVFHHPNIIEAVVATHDPALKMAYEGLTSAIFGNVNVTVCDSLEAALDYVSSKQ